MELLVKNLPASGGDIRDAGSIPGSGRSPGEGNPVFLPGNEIAGLYSNSTLNFLRRHHALFSMSTVSFYTTINTVQGLQYLHIPANSCSFFFCSVVVILIGEKCYLIMVRFVLPS